MNKNKRHLELAVVKVDGDQVSFRIAEQTHYGKDFCQKGKVFKAKNGIQIASLSETIIGGISPVWGEYDCDNVKLLDIMEAVTEYNETDGKGYEKPWPQDGSGYYCVNDRANVGYYIYSSDFIDEERRKAGNFFRTKEEAEAARERVKKALKGE